MASKNKQKAATGTPPKAKRGFQFRQRASIVNITQFRRGSDGKWHFFGQQPDEVVRLIIRKHWWFLIQPGLPLLGAVALFFLFLAGTASIPSIGSLWYVLDIVAVGLIILTGIRFFYKDLVSWWFETHIITNKRLIDTRGLLQPTRSDTNLDKVQQVGTDVKTFLGFLFGFGIVYVYLAGKTIELRDVPNIKRIRDALQGVTQEIKAKKKSDPPLVKPQNEAMATIIDELAKKTPAPTLPKADDNLPPPRNESRFLGPRRTFGGPLRIRANLHYVAGEYTVKYVQRSRYILWRNLSAPIGLLLVVALIAFLVPPVLGASFNGIQHTWWIIMGSAVLLLLIIMGLTYANYIDDMYILTNQRVIDINRAFIFFFETRIEAEYKNVRDVTVKISNLVERFLDIGNVSVETQGNSPDIILSHVDHPFLLQDEIQGIRGHKEKEEKANKENAEKEHLQKWFSTIFAQLDKTTKSAPDLRDKHIVMAMALAQEQGLDVSISRKVEAIADKPPGIVIDQSPPPGTMMAQDSKIEVILSKKQ